MCCGVLLMMTMIIMMMMRLVAVIGKKGYVTSKLFINQSQFVTIREKNLFENILEREKMIMSSISHFYPQYFPSFQVQSYYLYFLPFTRRQNLRLAQIESICRWQIKCYSKCWSCLSKNRNHCGKRRKCWLPAFSSFPTMFSKGLFLQCVISRHCVVKG